MFYRAPLGASARLKFLENTRDSLIESLHKPDIAEAVGMSTVERLIKTNSLLFTAPVTEKGEVIVTLDHLRDDSVPVLALKPRETAHINPAVALPSPRQNTGIQRFLDSLINDVTTEEVAGRELDIVNAMRRTLGRKGIDISLAPNANGNVSTSATLIDGRGIGSKPTPGFFIITGRPRMALAYKGGYPHEVVLAHEMIHVDQSLKTVVHPFNEGRLRRQAYRRELEAHHFSALLIRALGATAKPIKSLWAQTEIPLYEMVEKIRQRYADPQEPFEPTDRIIEELNKIGVEWGPSKKDFLSIPS